MIKTVQPALQHFVPEYHSDFIISINHHLMALAQVEMPLALDRARPATVGEAAVARLDVPVITLLALIMIDSPVTAHARLDGIIARVPALVVARLPGLALRVRELLHARVILHTRPAAATRAVAPVLRLFGHAAQLRPAAAALPLPAAVRPLGAEHLLAGRVAVLEPAVVLIVGDLEAAEPNSHHRRGRDQQQSSNQYRVHRRGSRFSRFRIAFASRSSPGGRVLDPRGPRRSRG